MVSPGSANILTPESLEAEGKESKDLPEGVTGTEMEAVTQVQSKGHTSLSLVVQ